MLLEFANMIKKRRSVFYVNNLLDLLKRYMIFFFVAYFFIGHVNLFFVTFELTLHLVCTETNVEGGIMCIVLPSAV